jgi:hypothetical protein
VNREILPHEFWISVRMGSRKEERCQEKEHHEIQIFLHVCEKNQSIGTLNVLRHETQNRRFLRSQP